MEIKSRPLVRGALPPDFSAVAFDDSFYSRQADPGSGPVSMEPPEDFEDVLVMSRGDADPVVADREGPLAVALSPYGQVDLWSAFGVSILESVIDEVLKKLDQVDLMYLNSGQRVGCDCST